jgi:hypothetical protein
MNTRTAHFGIVFDSPRAAQRSPRPSPAAALRPAPGLLERLAAWSERQPMHHRLGSWTCIG